MHLLQHTSKKASKVRETFAEKWSILTHHLTGKRHCPLNAQRMMKEIPPRQTDCMMSWRSDNLPLISASSRHNQAMETDSVYFVIVCSFLGRQEIWEVDALCLLPSIVPWFLQWAEKVTKIYYYVWMVHSRCRPMSSFLHVFVSVYSDRSAGICIHSYFIFICSW